MAAQNRAVFLPAAKSPPYQVRDAATPVPGAKQLVIRAAAWGINPVDHKLQAAAIYPLPYPFVTGFDVAGTVVQVGPGVTRFKPGDRVAGIPKCTHTRDVADAGFQLFPRLDEHVVYRIPDSMAWGAAAALPTALNTNFHFLYKLLGLPRPQLAAPPPSAKTVVVWGGSSSCGAMAIQLARLSGVRAVTTTSPANFELVRRLGASAVIDRGSASVVEDVAAALRGTEVLGVFNATGGPSEMQAAAVAKAVGVETVYTTTPPAQAEMDGVKVQFATGGDFWEVSWAEELAVFASDALAKGLLEPGVSVDVVGHGLEAIQTGVDRISQGVSAKKLVVLA